MARSFLFKELVKKGTNCSLFVCTLTLNMSREKYEAREKNTSRVKKCIRANQERGKWSMKE